MIASAVPVRIWLGHVTMTPRIYQTLVTHAGRHAIHRYDPQPVDLTAEQYQRALDDATTALYIATNVNGRAVYCGQARRGLHPRGAANARIVEHMAAPSKRAEWTSLWVVPLLTYIRDDVLDDLERSACALLRLPVRNLTWRALEKMHYVDAR